MSGRQIEIIIDITDRTKGKVEGLKKQLDALDKQAARLANRFKSFATQRHMATLALIDRVTAPASRINRILQKLSTTAWRISFKVADGALASVRKIESSILKIANKVYPIKFAVQGLANGVTNKINGLLSGAALGAGLMPLAGAMGAGYGVTSAITAYKDFEYQISKVRALTRLEKNSPEFNQLVEQSKALGRSTEWTRTEVAQAQYYQSKAGWSPAQIKNATPSILNLATASDSALDATSDILTDFMTAAGVKAGENYVDSFGNVIESSKRIADIMAATVTNSNTDLYQLGEASKYSAPLVGAMYQGKGIQKQMQGAEDLMILTGLMASGGVKGSQAGTSARAVLQRFGSENRNALYGLKFSGVEFVDKMTNEVRPIIDIMKDLNRVFNQGVDPNQLINFAEEIEGVKLHADTRRKIEGLLGNAQAHGGKLGGADRLKLASMLAGTEAMSGILLGVTGDIEALEKAIRGSNGAAEEMANVMRDNLAGSFKLLGSAWDSFQQGLLEGKGGEGIRSFIDSLTAIISRADKLFQDGIQLADIGKIIGDVFGRLKNKFLEFDGIGSALAGGALVAGLMKIISLGRRAADTLKGFGKAGVLGAASGMSAAQRIGTMTISAGVVNVNGRLAGGAGGYYGGGRAGVPGVIGSAAPNTAAAVFAAQRQFDRMNARFIAAQTKRNARWGRVENLFAMGAGDKQLARARTLARNYDEKTFLPAQARYTAARQALINARVADYQAQIAASKQSIAFAREQEKLMSASRWSNVRSTAAGGMLLSGIFGALDFANLKSMNAERLAAAAPDERAQILKENKRAEFEAGAGIAGSMIGTAIGAGLGSFAGPLGTAIGSVVGGVLGDYLGRIFGKDHADNATNKTVEDVTKKNDTPSWASFRAAEDASRNYYLNNQNIPEAAKGTSWEKIQLGSSARRRAADRDEAWKLKTEKFHADQEAAMRRNGITKVTETMDKIFGKSFLPSVTAAQEYYRAQSQDMGAANVKPISALSEMLSNIFSIGKRAEAAELTPEQMAQQAAMEAGTFNHPSEPITIPSPTIEPLETSPVDAWFNLDEIIARVSEIGTSITEQLASSFEGAGEIFNGLSETIGTAMDTASSMATSALDAIQSAFTSAKDTVQAAWGELPGFFSGVFGGLGGAAEAAGSAIYSGLTSIIGSIIGAWQSAASTISGIISSIASMAASAGSAVGGVIASVIPGHAEGGFISRPEVALIGEKGAEVVIPLNGSQRALDLYKKTGEVLGISDEFGDSAISGSSSGSNNGSGGVSIGNVNVNLEISATDGNDIVQKIREHAQEISDVVAASLSEAVATVHKNQTLCA